MKINNRILRNISTVIVLVMVMSSFSLAFAEGKIIKDETVYVNLDPDELQLRRHLVLGYILIHL